MDAAIQIRKIALLRKTPIKSFLTIKTQPHSLEQRALSRSILSSQKDYRSSRFGGEIDGMRTSEKSKIRQGECCEYHGSLVFWCASSSSSVRQSSSNAAEIF